MSYQSEFFQLHEVVPAWAIQARGEQAWQLMDDRILRAADWLRSKFGATVINGKIGDHKFTESGLRDPFTETGGKYSQHKFGRALDLKFLKTTPVEVYKFLMENQEEARRMGITTVEDISFTKTWLHIDCRALPKGFAPNKLLVVKP